MPQRQQIATAHPTTAHGYVETVPAADVPLLERLMALIEETCPDVEPQISYNMLCWKRGHHRLYIGAFRHGLSLYGWAGGGEQMVSERFPQLKNGKGTIRLDSAGAAQLTDDDLRVLIRAALLDPPIGAAKPHLPPTSGSARVAGTKVSGP